MMYTIETDCGVDLVPPLDNERSAREAALLSSLIIRGSVSVNARHAGGTLSRFIGLAIRGRFVEIEA